MINVDTKKAIEKLLALLRRRPNPKGETGKSEKHITGHDYFALARNWSDDFYAQAVAARNRWKAAALYGLLPLSVALLFCVVLLVPAQHLEPILVNHYEHGLVSVLPLAQNKAPTSPAEVESEIVRYVINRESYSAASYDEQYSLVNLLSSGQVAGQYMQEQSASNKSSPINTLGNNGTRTVHVESVVFLDNAGDAGLGPAKHHNLAEVNFTVTEHDTVSGARASVPLTALVSWAYRGTPSDPSVMWQNWDGFTVTSYAVQQRNV